MRYIHPSNLARIVCTRRLVFAEGMAQRLLASSSVCCQCAGSNGTCRAKLGACLLWHHMSMRGAAGLQNAPVCHLYSLSSHLLPVKLMCAALMTMHTSPLSSLLQKVGLSLPCRIFAICADRRPTVYT